MPRPTIRRVVTSAVVIASALSLSASTGTAGPPQPPSREVRGTSVPLTLVVQMTGLLMLVPENKSGKPTHIFAPPPPDEIEHTSFIVFRDDGTAACAGRGEGLCGVSMEGWYLEPIGATGGSGTARIPFNAVNYSRGAGGVKLNLARARDTARAWVTLNGGSATPSPCGLATWMFDDYGPSAPDWVPIANVLEWTIPNLRDSVVLIRRKIKNPEEVDTLATLRPDSAGRVELLFANITGTEGRNVFTAEFFSQLVTAAFAPGQRVQREEQAHAHAAAPATHGIAALNEATEEVETHVRAYYRFLRADPSRHRFPRSPIPTDSVCPITILGLEDWDGSTTVQRGIKTFGCVVGSGDS